MISKVDYLKKYLSKEEDAPDSSTDSAHKKKKKKKKKLKTPTVKIIDSDVFIGGSESKEDLDDKDCDEETALRLGRGEELPSVAGVVDSRPMDVIIKEKLSTGEWKPLEGWNQNNAPVGMLNKIKEEPLSPRSQESSDSRKRHDSSDGETDYLSNSRRGRSPHQSEKPSRKNRWNSDNPSVHSDRQSRSPRKKRHDSSDESPVRKTSHRESHKRCHDSSDESPPRRASNSARTRHDSSDASPPRKARPSIKQEPDDDLSPPRKIKIKQEPGDSDASPPRRSIKEEPDSDVSPPRMSVKKERLTYDSDASPPRRRSSVMTKTLDGKKAGLQDGKTLKKEMNEIRGKERETFSKLSNDVSGKGAETKIRGRLKEKEELKRQKQKEHEIPDEVKQKYSRWSKGLKQLEETEIRIKEDLHEMDKPLARSRDDKDLDEYLRNIEREEDPMLKFIKKKKVKSTDKNEGPRYPKYKGPEPFPNRFGIPPGYRWDGVDRSNGFEKKLVDSANKKKALAEEALKWSQEDM